MGWSIYSTTYGAYVNLFQNIANVGFSCNSVSGEAGWRGLCASHKA